MELTELYAALEAAFPPQIVTMGILGSVKIQQFQAQIVNGEPQVFLTDPTEERLAQLQEALALLND